MIVTDCERIGQWVSEKAGGTYTGQAAIGVEHKGVLVAGVIYNDFTGGSIIMGSRIDSPYGLKEFYWFAFYYPFMQLGVKNVRGIVSVLNHKAQRLNEHLGFTREAILRDYFPEADAIIYVMAKDECRFLKEDYAPKFN